jgi:hypothetical protein
MKIAAAILIAALTASNCSGPPPVTQPPFTGLWVGSLPAGPAGARDVAVALHERAGLKLIGHWLGGTSQRTLLGGFRHGDGILLVFDMKDAGIGGPVTLSGAVSGDTLTGTATVGGDSFPVTWTRSATPLTVRNFVFVDPSVGDQLAEVSIVQDGAGALVSGQFTSANCGFIACGGGVTAFAEAPDGALTISLLSDGACSGAGAITATFNASESQYAGTWTHTAAASCGGAATAGSLVGGRDMGTTSPHAASVLANLGQLAEDLEAGATFAAPYAPLSPSYLHFGEDNAGFIAAHNAEVAAHPDIVVEFSNVAALRTVVPTGQHPLLLRNQMVTFADHRRDASGSYLAVEAGTPGQTGLYHIAEEAGAWRFIGNQVGEFDLPFAYTIGAERLLVPTGGGSEVLHLSLGSWGAHFGPLTGHLEGNAKADMMAQYVGAASALTELTNGPGGTAGVCDVPLVWSGSEVCGVWGGLGGELIRSRLFAYRAPYAGTVRDIIYQERPRPVSAPETHYFDNAPHWSVHVDFPGGLTIRFVHVGRLTGAVAAGFASIVGQSPDTYAPPAAACPPSPARCEVEVLGSGTFDIPAHAEIGLAQTDAAAIPGHPGYFRGQIGPSIAPWSQVEFFMSETVGNRGGDVCPYQYLPAAKQTMLAGVMTADMLNPSSLRYAANDFVRPWRYRAEAELCNNGGYLIRHERDFSAIHAQLGGWYERAALGTTPNEQFTIARIHQGAAAYSAALYDVLIGTTNPTEYLVARRRTDSAPYAWSAPGTGALSVWYPAGEVLELTDAGFVVKWREISGATLYQRAAYALGAEGLKIKWGPFSTTLAGATVPTLSPGEACNDTTTLCYNHTRP